MRYTLTDSSAACDEVLAGAIYDFLALMQDPDHVSMTRECCRLERDMVEFF